MTKFFFLLSGEHETLPYAELKAILATKRVKHVEIERLPQVLRLDSTLSCVDPIRNRASMTRTCCQELLNCESSLVEIVKAMQFIQLGTLLQQGDTFVVRVHRVGLSARRLTSMVLEQKLGELILSKIKGVKVNLKNPLKTFFGIITGDRFLFGLRLATISPTPFLQRGPRKRPFFHPSAMPAKLARCMVNLAGAREGDLLLDRFCGTGGFLIEGGLLGCRIVGFDAKKHMVEGTDRNLSFFNLEYDGLGVADAKHLPLKRVDCIVTDPPYGRSASTLGHTTERVIQEFLPASSSSMSQGKRMCIAAPKKVHISKLAEDVGFKLKGSYFVYIHRSLTREILVLEQT